MNNGQVGNIQVLNAMRNSVAQRRAAGQTTVPIEWVDSWIVQLEADYGGYQRPYQQPYGYPVSPYAFPFFHPIDTFFPFTTFTFRTSRHR